MKPLRLILAGTDVNTLFDDITTQNLKNFAAYEEGKGSGWRLHHIISYELKFSRYALLNGSSYIPLPDVLKNKNALINVKNADNECFKWSVTRAINPVARDAERVTKELKRQSKIFKWVNVSFPTTFDDITTFERNNKVSVKVFGWDEDKGEITCLRLPERKHYLTITFFLLEADDGRHYCVGIISAEQRHARPLFLRLLQLHHAVARPASEAHLCRRQQRT